MTDFTDPRNDKCASCWPIGFRAIGWGESSGNLIEEIREFGYDGFQADVISTEEVLTPTDYDKMIIFICAEAHEGLASILNTFHQAGVLTIVISTEPLNISDNVYDSLMIANRNEIVSVVRTLLGPIFFKGQIMLDFSDLAPMLRDSGCFVTLNATGSGEYRMKNAVKSLSELFSLYEHVENLSLIIRYNDRTIEPPLGMYEMTFIMEYISQLPVSIDVIWGIYNDEMLDCNTVGLSVIASGKDMSIKR